MVSTPLPLLGRTVVEIYTDTTDDVAKLSIAFAGRIAADLGATVVSVNSDGSDPLEDWEPLLPDGSSSVAQFLNHAKMIANEIPAGAADLLTNDPELASAWSNGVVVLVRAAGLGPVGASELTVLASVGLLDILGESGRAPLAMPGNQVAYSAGVAAFDALVASIFAETFGSKRLKSDVSVIDVAEWLNWKHFLAAYFGQFDVGIGRAEDWNVFACEDGYIAVAFQDKDVPALARLVGDSALNDSRFSTLKRRRQNIEVFNAIIASWAKARKRDEIIDSARLSKLPFGPVLTVSDMIGDRQMLSRAFIDLNKSSKRYGVARLPAVWSNVN